MQEQLDRVVSSSTPAGATEEQMLRANLVQEMVARAQRGEGAKRIARELGSIATVSSGSHAALVQKNQPVDRQVLDLWPKGRAPRSIWPRMAV